MKLPVVVSLSLSLASACNTPPTPPAPAPPPASASASASALAPASASASALALTPASAPCKSDTDCRTLSSYCIEAPCACRVLAATAPDPKCKTPQQVSCLVDPCQKKAAGCQSGACVLTAK